MMEKNIYMRDNIPTTYIMPPKPKQQVTNVKNINGTSSDRYKINNLSEKYIESGGSSRKTCAVYGCSKEASATAHVMKSHGNADSTWYLVKTCAQHNSHYNNNSMPVPTSNLIALSQLRQ